MPIKNKRSLEDLDHAIAWSVEETARKIGGSRNWVNCLVNEGRLRAATNNPRRLLPDHVKAQLEKGFPELSEA